LAKSENDTYARHGENHLAMLNCRQATRLISQSMDTSLPWPRRLAVRFHLLYCVWCRRYAAQLKILRKAAKQLSPEDMALSSHHLSREAKEQMQTRLQQALKEPPKSPQ
jgi:hypothetical protein